MLNNINCVYSINTWIEIPNIEHKDYLLLQLSNLSDYIIFCDEPKSIIYRDGYFEAGGNFAVYKLYNGIWSLIHDDFGSPANQALLVTDTIYIVKASSKNNIIDINTGKQVICTQI